MVLDGSPVNGIPSDDLGAVEALENVSPMPDEGRFTDEVNMKDIDLILVEKRVMALAVSGYSSAESAEILGISEPAFRQHLTGLFDKLHVSNCFELLLFALHHRLLVA